MTPAIEATGNGPLRGLTALVTGGAKGIGLAIARRLAAETRHGGDGLDGGKAQALHRAEFFEQRRLALPEKL